MPKIDFSKIDDVADYTPIPAGEYLCRLADVEESQTNQGYDMWRLKWLVEEGEFTGRCLFDNLPFTPKAMPRVKLICGRMRVDVSGEVDLQPEHLLDRQVLVTVTIEDYEDEEGNTKKCNRVPFAGYEFSSGATNSDEGNPPF